MGNNSFGGGVSGMGMSGRNMPGLGGGVPSAGSGLNLGGTNPSLQSGLNAGRLGGGGGFGSMQGGQTSYNPSGEILAMINKGQNVGLGLPPNQPLGISSLPAALSQPGMPPNQQSLNNLGMPTADLGSGIGGVPSSPSFDMSDFPSLGQRSTSTSTVRARMR